MDWYKKAIEQLGWIEITKWSVIDENGYHHNHIENGHSKMDSPANVFGVMGWKNQVWSKLFCYAYKGSLPLKFVR